MVLTTNERRTVNFRVVNPTTVRTPGGTTNTTNTQGTQGTQGVNTVNQGGGGNQTGTGIVGDPNATGVSAPPSYRPIQGLPAAFDAAKLAANNGGRSGAAEGMTGTYIARPSSGYFVGYGDIAKVSSTPEGFKVDLKVFTESQKDEFALILQLPVLDKKSGKLTYLNLDVLTADGLGSFVQKVGAQVQDPISKKNCFGSELSYSFSLAQINDYLANQGLPLVVKPGDQLAIAGIVDKSGHRVMNSASNNFSVPAPLGTAGSAVAARVNNNQNQIRAQDLPLDITVKLPQDVLDEQIYDHSTGRNVRIGDIISGEITTRLESEYKGSVDGPQMDQMITNAYKLADMCAEWEAIKGDPSKQFQADLLRSKIDKELGDGLVLSPVQRHWMASDGQPVGERDINTLQIPRDARGWPTLDPMKDGYSDDKKMSFAEQSGAVRVRGNAQKQGHAEFKLNGGVVDPKTGIRQRVELGVSLQPGANEEQFKSLLSHMRDYPGKKLAQSPLGQLLTDSTKLGLTEALIDNRTPWADVTQIRHKFELKNLDTGTKAELSLDMVHSQTLRAEHQVNGQPQERTYFVIETELDHLQINSANVTQMGPTVGNNDKAALTNPTEQASYVDQVKQQVAAGGADLEILTKPQLHSVDHVSEGSFRQTESYKDFEGMNASLLDAICGSKKPGPARQKSAHFAELIGLVQPEQTVTT